MNSWYHAKSSARKWGGAPEQYIDIHEFIDSSKKIIGDVRHRSIYHHTEGVWLCQKIFGRTIKVGGRFAVQNEDLSVNILDENPPVTGPNFEIVDYGRIIEVPVRLIAELHIEQDLGWIPSPVDYIKNMELKQWMGGAVRKEASLDGFMRGPEDFIKKDQYLYTVEEDLQRNMESCQAAVEMADEWNKKRGLDSWNF